MDGLEDLRDFQNDVADLSSFRARRRRKTKNYRVRFNSLQSLSDEEFKLRYRFSKENMSRIIEIVRPDIQGDTRGGSISVELQVMSVIRYWARHEIQEDNADIHGMSQQTLSRLSRKVAIALASKSSRYIKMPSNISEEINAIRKFEAICGLQFPVVSEISRN